MKKRLHLFIIILALGIFLLPAMAYACGTKVEKECCKKENAAKTAQTACCKNKNSSSNNDQCNGKCGHSNCTSSSSHLSIILISEIEFTGQNAVFSAEKPRFYDSDTYISSGFTSVWLRPKIK